MSTTTTPPRRVHVMSGASMNFEQLKQYQREQRECFSDSLRLRSHRALSWLQRAEMAEDLDGRFIFLWIAFNAAYATEVDASLRTSTQDHFREFFQRINTLDQAKKLDDLVWNEFTGNIRTLLDNPYVFQPFWEWQAGALSEEGWRDRFRRAKTQAGEALAASDTPKLLMLVFQRLYTMRNQLIHGGATWNSFVNREQMLDSTRLLHKVVPVIITIMMENPTEEWGRSYFPVVDAASI